LRPSRPSHAALYAVAVRQAGALPTASFRPRLATAALAVRLAVPATEARRGLAPPSHRAMPGTPQKTVGMGSTIPTVRAGRSTLYRAVTVAGPCQRCQGVFKARRTFRPAQPSPGAPAWRRPLLAARRTIVRFYLPGVSFAMPTARSFMLALSVTYTTDLPLRLPMTSRPMRSRPR